MNVCALMKLRHKIFYILKQAVVFSLSFILLCQVLFALATIYETTVIHTTGRIVSGSGISMLHTEGAHLVNDLGERVHLHGICKNEFIRMGTGNFPGSGATWEELVKNNLATLQDWGANFMAMGVNVVWWLNNEDNVRTNYVQVVQWAEEYGIYVAIGVFGWDYPDNWAGWDAAHMVIANPQTYKDFWLSVSNTFLDAPNIIYGSLIEVGVGPSPELTEDEINQYFNVVKDAVQAIRNNGDNHIFLYHEGYCNYPAYFDKPVAEGGEMKRQLHTFFDNIVYDAHVYRYHNTFGNNPDVFTPTEEEWTNCDGVYQREDIMDALTYWGYLKILNEYQVPIIMWEGGASRDVSPPNSWFKELTCWKNLLSIFNELDIGYGAFWWSERWPWALVNDDLTPTEWGQSLIDAIAELTGEP